MSESRRQIEMQPAVMPRSSIAFNHVRIIRIKRQPAVDCPPHANPGAGKSCRTDTGK